MKSNMKHNWQFSHLDESHCQRKCFCFFCFEEVIATIWTNVLLLLPVWGMRLFVLTTTEPGRCHGEKKNVLSIKSFVLVEDKNLNVYVNGCFSPTLLIKNTQNPGPANSRTVTLPSLHHITLSSCYFFIWGWKYNVLDQWNWRVSNHQFGGPSLFKH